MGRCGPIMAILGVLLGLMPALAAAEPDSTLPPRRPPPGSSTLTGTPPPVPPEDPRPDSTLPDRPEEPPPGTDGVIVVPAFAPPAPAPDGFPPRVGPADAVPGEILAVSRSLAEATALAQALGPRGYRVLRRQPLAFLGGVITAFRLPANLGLDAALTELRQDFPQHIVGPNGLLGPADDSSTSARRYAKTLIGWQAASGCGTTEVIGLIDTAIDLDHAALSGQRVISRSFLPAGVNPGNADHGTAVAALLIGDGADAAFAGLLSGATLRHASVFHRTDEREAVATVERVVIAVDWLGTEGVRLVNMSLETGANPVIGFAMTGAGDKGMILVAAAGNGGAGAPPAFPAAHPDVIAVTAIDAGAKIYRNANRGDYIDLAAPGVDLWTAKAGGGGSYRSGTSFAVPFVVAAIAIERAANPTASAPQLFARVRAGARDLGPKGHDATFGHGLVTAPGPCAITSAN